MEKIKYFILFFFINGNVLAVEVISDCQYKENNILDLHFVIEHPIIGTETLINISCSANTQSMHCSGIQLNLNMLSNGILQDGFIKHKYYINVCCNCISVFITCLLLYPVDITHNINSNYYTMFYYAECDVTNVRKIYVVCLQTLPTDWIQSSGKVV